MRRIKFMNNTVIIIPSRLKAKRLPNKPIKLIRGKEMILHVFNLAVKSGAGEVLVTTPDKKISDLIILDDAKYFDNEKPLSGYGEIILGESYILSGEVSKGETLLKKGWITADLTKAELKSFRKKFKNI